MSELYYSTTKLDDVIVLPVTDPALIAHRPLAVAAVDVQSGGGLVQTGDGAARAQFDDLVRHVPQLEALQ